MNQWVNQPYTDPYFFKAKSLIIFRKNHYSQPIYVEKDVIIPYPTAFPYGNGMVLHFYQQQESSTKSLTRDLKLMYSRLTLVRISINL